MQIPELTNELCARIEFAASTVIEKPDDTEAVNNYYYTVSPAIVIALINQNTRMKALLQDLMALKK